MVLPFTVAGPLGVGLSGENPVPPDIGLMYCVSPGRGPGPCLVLLRARLLQSQNANTANAAKAAMPATVPPTMAPVRLTFPLLVPLVEGASVPVEEDVDEDDVDDDPVVADLLDEVALVVDAELVVFEVWSVDVFGDEMVSVVVRDPDVVVSVLEASLLAVGDCVEVDRVLVLAVKETVTLSTTTSEVRPVALLATVAARSLAVPQPY